MCCCDKRHSNDPAYKQSVCCSPPNCIFALLALGGMGYVLYIMIAISGALEQFCGIAKYLRAHGDMHWGHHDDHDDGGQRYFVLDEPMRTCKQDSDCGDGKSCRGECGMTNPGDGSYQKWKSDLNNRDVSDSSKEDDDVDWREDPGGPGWTRHEEVNRLCRVHNYLDNLERPHYELRNCFPRRQVSILFSK